MQKNLIDRSHSYVIITEVVINLYRILNDHSCNEEAEKYLVENYMDYNTDGSTFEF